MATRIAILIALLLAPVASANEDAPPPVTNDSLNGVWEGVVGDWGVHRMDVRARGNSYLAEVSSPQKDFQVLYQLVQRDVRSGHVVLRFRKVAGADWRPAEIMVKGEGYAFGDEGELQTTLTYMKGEKGSYKLRLEKGTRTRILAKMSKQAEHLIPR
jgi:hypothetical protein